MGPLHILRCFLGCACVASALECDFTISDAEKLKVRHVVIKSRLNTLSPVALPLRPGQVFRIDDVSASFELIRQELARQDPAAATAGGYVMVRYIDHCASRVGTDEVDVVIRPWSIRVPLPAGFDRKLLQPRANWPTLLANLPPGLRAVNPSFELAYDRNLDTMPVFGFATSLNTIRDAIAREPDSDRKRDLLLSGMAQRSIGSDNYAAVVRTEWEQRFPAKARRLSVGTQLAAARQPLGIDTRLLNSMRNGVNFRTGLHRVLRQIGISLDHRWEGNRTTQIRTTEQAVQLRADVDYKLPSGLGRTHVTTDRSWPNTLAAYSRISVRSGYSGEIPLRSDHTIGVDAQISAARGSRALPNYASFFGGNNGLMGSHGGTFVTDTSFASVLDDSFVDGPVVRGYGSSSAALNGGALGATSHWGFNLNVALPVPRWSRFLIPKEPDDDGVPLGQRIENAGLKSSQSFLTAHYKNEGMTQADAEARAKGDVDSIRPAVVFIARRAKIYAVRPFGLFDFAKLRRLPASRTISSAGGGVQLTVVVAKFEVGYARVLDRKLGDPPGNVVFRLSFVNLF